MSTQTTDRRHTGTRAADAETPPMPATSKDLVELLTQEGLVDDSKVTNLLSEQRKSSERIVSLLLQRNLISEAELVGFLSKRYRIPRSR